LPCQGELDSDAAAQPTRRIDEVVVAADMREIRLLQPIPA
jgi:hypothetical protein